MPDVVLSGGTHAVPRSASPVVTVSVGRRQNAIAHAVRCWDRPGIVRRSDYPAPSCGSDRITTSIAYQRMNAGLYAQPIWKPMSGVLSKLPAFSVIANVHTDASTRWRTPTEI